MNLSEFKAWFDGFSENLDGPPNEKQWKRVKAKMAEIRDLPPQIITREVYRDYWRPYYGWGVVGNAAELAAAPNSMVQAIGQCANAIADKPNGGDIDGGTVFDAKEMFRAMGRLDAQTAA